MLTSPGGTLGTAAGLGGNCGTAAEGKKPTTKTGRRGEVRRGKALHRSKQAEREGDEHPDEQQDDDAAEGNSRQRVVGDGDGIEDASNAEAQQREEVCCQQHCPDPVLAFVAGIEAATAPLAPSAPPCFKSNIKHREASRASISKKGCLHQPYKSTVDTRTSIRH